VQSESGKVERIPGFYVWEVPGKSISIQLSLDVVDRLQQDVIRGFGAVPRRGAEVGGVLLGSATSEGPVVRIEDYELIPIEYKRGPSYLLSDDDVQALEGSLEQLRQREEKSLRPIGYFRSHTRDAAGLGPEDQTLVAKYFPEAETVVLLIRPFGTKPSIAGFYFKENDAFQEGPPLQEFSFRRKDLAPDEAPRKQAPPHRPGRNVPLRREIPTAEPERPAQTFQDVPTPSFLQGSVPIDVNGLVDGDKIINVAKKKSGLWAPLSFIFLLLGVLVGFQAALILRPGSTSGGDAYNVSLDVSQSGSDLQLKWDRQSTAIRSAQKGILTIEDGSLTSKPTELSASELQSGSVVVYPHSSNRVSFHLELLMKDAERLIETVEWKASAP
jgi:hypothetical protein